MTQKDFELIADTLRTQVEVADAGTCHEDMSTIVGFSGDLANAFADRLATTNPRFNRARFLRACGVEA